MSISFYMPGIMHGHEDVALANLEAVVADLRRYRVEGGPTLEELEAAPLLSDWHALPDRSGLRLAGRVTGHPHVGPGPATTSRVYAISRHHGWMRAANRLWRLGPPCMPGLQGTADA